MKFKKQRKILIPYGAKRNIAKRFEVSEKTVDNAINFYSESELAETIRNAAINEYGGRETTISKAIKRIP